MAGGFSRIGFIGLGVMGEPMCRNLATKTRIPVIGFDTDPGPLARLKSDGVDAGSLRAALAGSEVVFLSLPSGEVVETVARQPDGLLANVTAGQIVIDLSTSAVDTTRRLARDFDARGVTLVDAPVARTRAAAVAGTLSIMVGATPEVFARIRPLLATFGSDIALCGPVGCGQVLKILNNMLLFQIGRAVGEAKAIGERAGVEPGLLLEVLSKGSADSFALRNHGMKAMLPGDFPERAFSVEYARKDLRYALRLAEETQVDVKAAVDVDTLFQQAIDAGWGDLYWPVISRLAGR